MARHTLGKLEGQNSKDDRRSIESRERRPTGSPAALSLHARSAGRTDRMGPAVGGAVQTDLRQIAVRTGQSRLGEGP